MIQIHNYFTRQCNFFHINKGHSNVNARRVRKISPQIWNAIEKKNDVNVSIINIKRTPTIYFMEHDLEITYTE